ncbi:MAG: M23 family metallopeptidase [Rhodospirillales bacterium]
MAQHPRAQGICPPSVARALRVPSSDELCYGWRMLKKVLLPVVLSLLFSGPIFAGHGQALDLGLPIDCKPGEDCWVVNYPDLKDGEGVQDYACGQASYEGHKGIDIALRDTARMRDGVDVLAAAAGTVMVVRDGIRDVDVNEIGFDAVKSVQCGNQVILLHEGNWATTYCHLRQNSLTVKKGDRVDAGQTLGKVGLSGLTEFPHAHLHVQRVIDRKGKVVDPFVGEDRQNACGLGPKPLWKPEVLADLGYQPTAIFNIGLSPTAPTVKGIRDGLFLESAASADAPLLALWVEIFNLAAEDKVEFRITDPQGKTVYATAKRLEKRQARWTYFVGKRRKGGPFAPGDYSGSVRVVREGAELVARKVEIKIK